MNILLVLIPVTLLLVTAAGVAFFWAVDHDQFNDMETPGLLPLLDDSRPSVDGVPEPPSDLPP
jgi:cbb3-type cytochrome oxidase maturation protein